LFRVSSPNIAVNAGDAVYFPADKVCHRAPPLHHHDLLSGGKRRRSQGAGVDVPDRLLLFWFSWDEEAAAVASAVNIPDVDFQLNPWTLHHLLHASEYNYLHSKVFSFLFFLFSDFLTFLFSRMQQHFLWTGWIIIHTSISWSLIRRSCSMTMQMYFR